MPQGKGTYGSQVGRPSKKKYDEGGSVDPFSLRNPEGVPQEQAMDMLEDANMEREGLPISNAQERSQVSPDVTSYKEGGKVDVTDVVKEVSTSEKLKRMDGKMHEKGDVPSGAEYVSYKVSNDPSDPSADSTRISLWKGKGITGVASRGAQKTEATKKKRVKKMKKRILK